MKKKQPTAADISLVAEAVRSLGVMFNTAAIYNRDHPVFQRAVRDRFPAIADCIAACRDVRLIVRDSALVYEGVTLEPGNEQFERMARTLAQKGVQGFTLMRGLQPDEITRFVLIVTQRLGTESGSLEDLLGRAKVRHIREAHEARGDGEGEGKPGESQSGVRQSAQESGVFELDLGGEPGENGLDDLFETAFQEASREVTPRQVKTFVLDELSDLARGKTTKEKVAQNIANEFQERLHEKVEDVKREMETQVRRLENIKDMVLQELEERNLAALVVNLQLQVIAMNSCAREILGALDRLSSDSELARFAQSREEKDTLLIGGVQRDAHMIITEHQDPDSGAVLICLD